MKKFVKGALLLTIGGFICKFIGAFFRIPLANVLGATGMGYYQMVFPIYSFALVFGEVGEYQLHWLDLFPCQEQKET